MCDSKSLWCTGWKISLLCIFASLFIPWTIPVIKDLSDQRKLTTPGQMAIVDTDSQSLCTRRFPSSDVVCDGHTHCRTFYRKDELLQYKPTMNQLPHILPKSTLDHIKSLGIKRWFRGRRGCGLKRRILHTTHYYWSRRRFQKRC